MLKVRALTGRGQMVRIRSNGSACRADERERLSNLMRRRRSFGASIGGPGGVDDR